MKTDFSFTFVLLFTLASCSHINKTPKRSPSSQGGDAYLIAACEEMKLYSVPMDLAPVSCRQTVLGNCNFIQKNGMHMHEAEFTSNGNSQATYSAKIEGIMVQIVEKVVRTSGSIEATFTRNDIICDRP